MTSDPWTPERIIECQAEQIARLKGELKSARKMIDALRDHAGRLQLLYRLTREVLDEVAPDD